MQVRTIVGHSAKVRLNLHVGGRVIPLSHIGPDFCIAREVVELEPQSAEIVADIDDQRHVHRVYLTNGMSSSSPTTVIRDRAD
jgi:hypothetical protein